MTSTVDELLAQARALSADDRELLLLRLQQELAAPMPPDVEQAWIEECLRREAAIDRGEEQLIPWEVVRRELGLK